MVKNVLKLIVAPAMISNYWNEELRKGLAFVYTLCNELG